MGYSNPTNNIYGGMPPPSSTPQPPSGQPPPNAALSGLPPNILALLHSAQQQQRPPGATPYGMPPQGMMNSPPPPLPGSSNHLQYQQLMSFLVSIFPMCSDSWLTCSSSRVAGNNNVLSVFLIITFIQKEPKELIFYGSTDLPIYSSCTIVLLILIMSFAWVLGLFTCMERASCNRSLRGNSFLIGNLAMWCCLDHDRSYTT